MSKIEDFGIPGAGAGILHPAFSHRWKVVIKSEPILTKQATKCHINLKDCTLQLEIEQPVQEAHEFLKSIQSVSRSSNFDIRVHLMDGDHATLAEIGGFGKVLEHSFVLDYALSEIATHKLLIKFELGA